MRTLEQKISDAGPTNQRIDPHVLTPVRKVLEKEGVIQRQTAHGIVWYSLGNTPPETIAARLATLGADFKAFSKYGVSQRIGQALEIATYRALVQANIPEFFGQFPQLDAPGEKGLYSKQEPPQNIGKRTLDGDKKLDFLIRHSEAGYLGLECKNVREWLYPDRSEITETLAKCLALDCVPVFVARRIPFVTFKLMNACGIIVHQTYNQFMSPADAAVAEQVKQKDSLGFHDIRVTDEPDARLTKFIGTNMMAVALEARQKFEEFKDLLESFSSKQISYEVFAAKVRRRLAGTNEDSDEEDSGPDPGDFLDLW